MNRYFDDDLDDDRSEPPPRRATGDVVVGRVAIEAGLGWVGLRPDGELAIEIDERALRSTRADRLGEHLANALNQALATTKPRS